MAVKRWVKRPCLPSRVGVELGRFLGMLGVDFPNARQTVLFCKFVGEYFETPWRYVPKLLKTAHGGVYGNR